MLHSSTFWCLSLITITLLCLATKCKDTKAQTSPKITFDLSQIGDDGLGVKPGSKVAIDYEYCIPADEQKAAELKRIDPSLNIMHESRGRIGCSKDQWLCLGNTHQKDWRKILLKIAELNYVTRIDQVFFE